MKNVILLILFIHCISVMGQQKQPQILFEKQNINLLLREENGTKRYLTNATVYAPVNNCFPYPPISSREFKKVKFTVVYVIVTEIEQNREIVEYVAHFIPKGKNYKIIQAHFSLNWFYRNDENDNWKEGMYEAKIPKFDFIAYSDNETLQVVKVWNYVKKYLVIN